MTDIEKEALLQKNILELKSDIEKLIIKKENIIKELNLPGDIENLKKEKKELMDSTEIFKQGIRQREKDQILLLSDSYAKQKKNLDKEIEDKKSISTQLMFNIQTSQLGIAHNKEAVTSLLKLKQDLISEIEVKNENLKTAEMLIEKKAEDLEQFSKILFQKDLDLKNHEALLNDNNSELTRKTAEQIMVYAGKMTEYESRLKDFLTQSQRWKEEVIKKESELKSEKDILDSNRLILNVKTKKIDEEQLALDLKKTELEKSAIDVSDKEESLLFREQNLLRQKSDLEYEKAKFYARK